jgi:tetratricopeptide (TPR) repeat protein
MTNLGWSLYKSGRVADSVKQLKAAIVQDPSYANAHKRLAAVCTYEKDSSTDATVRENYRTSAIAEWSEAVRLDPQDVAGCVNLGNLYLETRDLDKAAEQYRAGIKAEPDNPQARLGLGLVLVEQQKLDEAIEEYRNLVKTHPRLASAYNNLGVALEKKGQVEEAKAQYQKALQLEPNYADAKYNLDRLGRTP